MTKIEIITDNGVTPTVLVEDIFGNNYSQMPPTNTICNTTGTVSKSPTKAPGLNSLI